MKQRRTNKRKIKILIIVLSVIIIVCIIYLLIYLYYYIKNKNLYSDLTKNIEQNKTIEEIKETKSEYIENVKELQQENTDVKGWIRINNTNINYPLLQTSNNDYYLTHNYKKEKSSYGSIFINSNCDLKNNNSNIIIYGHDMKDNQMFRDLLKYQDEDFYKEHPIVIIATEEIEQEYQIVCAFTSRVFYQDEKNVFRFYQYYNFTDENKYNEYISNCKKIQLYDTGISAKYGEQLITLITCEYSQENGRMVVVAKKES